MPRICYLKGYGECTGPITGEHYISASVLRVLNGGNGTVRMGGGPWQPKGVLQTFGQNAVTAKILCERHNSGLSPLDDVAGKTFELLSNVETRPNEVRSFNKIDGLLLERWLVKLACGLVAAEGNSPPDGWKEWVLGLARPPHKTGLYVPIPDGKIILNGSFALVPLHEAGTTNIIGICFQFAAMPVNLLFRRPPKAEKWGVYRPRRIFYDTPAGLREFEFNWPGLSRRSIHFKRVGATEEPTELERGLLSGEPPISAPFRGR